MLRFFEDFPVGLSEVYGPVVAAKEAIVAFAREYDPQPFHVDEELAKRSFMGTLVASGWHTCALNMRLIADGFLLGATSLGSPGLEEVNWLKPVLPGDALRTRMTVTDARPSKSRPEVGLLHFRFEMLNQRDEAVMTQSNWIMFGRRGYPWPPAPGAGPPADAAPGPDPAPPPVARPPAYHDEMAVGDVTELGSYRFEADDIVTFARAYDPQPFHVDPEAAKRSLFGGLCASGWHTAAIWMKLLIAHRQRTEAQPSRRAPQLGPSPGFRNLRWLRPVYAGDTISYRSVITGLRASASRPGWGLAFHRNSGTNQHGDEVFSFEGMVFVERREPTA
ncbi:MAG TPA: MaoC family dehydratase [Microvirga sp.]|nr:MaoC family dehydratase [Microvirga sp.]